MKVLTFPVSLLGASGESKGFGLLEAKNKVQMQEIQHGHSERWKYTSGWVADAERGSEF